MSTFKTYRGNSIFNLRLLPELKKAPSARSIGNKYIYVPSFLSLSSELKAGSQVTLLKAPAKGGDPVVEVERGYESYKVLWRDLRRL